MSLLLCKSKCKSALTTYTTADLWSCQNRYCLSANIPEHTSRVPVRPVPVLGRYQLKYTGVEGIYRCHVMTCHDMTSTRANQTHLGQEPRNASSPINLTNDKHVNILDKENQHKSKCLLRVTKFFIDIVPTVLISCSHIQYI